MSRPLIEGFMGNGYMGNTQSHLRFMETSHSGSTMRWILLTSILTHSMADSPIYKLLCKIIKGSSQYDQCERRGIASSLWFSFSPNEEGVDIWYDDGFAVAAVCQWCCHVNIDNSLTYQVKINPDLQLSFKDFWWCRMGMIADGLYVYVLRLDWRIWWKQKTYISVWQPWTNLFLRIVAGFFYFLFRWVEKLLPKCFSC